MNINHQYSKSLEFESDFQNYVRENISPDVNYFSFLRPLSELKIAEVFCKNFLEKYSDNFSSCNANFRITDREDDWRWCCKCPKCAFVFLLFAPFVEREKLIEIFGDNLFAREDLWKTFAQLLGQQDNKPFECVGEVEEVKRSLQLAQETGQWNELEKFPLETSDYNEHQWHQHLMPSHFENILKTFLS